MKFKKLPRGGLLVAAARYLLEFRPAEHLVLLQVRGTHQRHMLFLGGACNTVGKRDETTGVPRLAVRHRGDAVEITFREHSSLWRAKRQHVVCRDASLEFFHEVEGRGAIEQTLYFRGYLEGGERGMASDMDEIYSTAPNFQERLYFHPGESFGISAGNYLDLPVGCQALASPCYCMGLHDRRDEAYLAVGLATEPGRYTWDRFQWNPPVALPATPLACDNALAGGFAAVYDGKLCVNGRWQSPRLVMTFARHRDQVLPGYLAYCRAHGCLPPPPRRRPVAWWREPIYCTWHDQNGLAARTTGMDLLTIGPQAGAFCTQKLSERWLRLLARQGCKPGIVILDALWAVNVNSGEPDPKKWPDMRDWIERCHQRGVRVFVWAPAWATEGLPVDECITRDGKPVACDITHPKYVRRFREMIRRWFSDAPGCLNADGVKLDGQLCVPTGPGLRSHGNLWGLELQRRYLETLYTEAKQHKPDACISTFALNPCLAEFTDMVRLGDMYTHRPTAREAMRDRAAAFRVAMPHAVIDTDGQFYYCALDDYAGELAEQARLGSPTLYTAEWVLRTRFFQPMRLGKLTKQDYTAFAGIFATHRRSCIPNRKPASAK